MAYRNPRFYFHHAYRLAGSAALGGSSFAAANPRARLHDSAITLTAQYAAAAANQYVKADRGAGYASLVQPDRLIVPAGHNFAGTTVEVRHNATDPGSGTTGTLIYNAAISAGLQVLSFSAALSNRYFLVNVPASGAWAFPELWITQLRTTTRGPDANWRDTTQPNVSRQELSSGSSFRLQRGADRREFEFTYRALAGADLQVFTDLRAETLNGTFPFYFDPPDDAQATILVELVEPLQFAQDFVAPQAGATFSVKLHVRECLA